MICFLLDSQMKIIKSWHLGGSIFMAKRKVSLNNDAFPMIKIS